MSDPLPSLETSQDAPPSIEIGYAVKAPKAGPAVRASKWTEWDGGQLGGRPVSCRTFFFNNAGSIHVAHIYLTFKSIPFSYSFPLSFGCRLRICQSPKSSYADVAQSHFYSLLKCMHLSMDRLMLFTVHYTSSVVPHQNV